ncbi:FOG: CBS domain [Pelotomaculum thermopropionicum SI]|uniref:FOG: CBS domain n=1 Tax=Pelotomaculum thermopropionicum (strain DSM 13744 / JCM 10971 / SI) TaxID=370438 RepID=A5D013_PELTS|nr:FOG: CBS domain [Pelotomaculum thermopropionicum SI]
MMEKKRTKVRDLMVPLQDYPVVYDTDTIKDAIKCLKSYLAGGREHRSLLVFSKTRKVGGEEELVGILTVRDILNALKTNRSGFDSSELFTMTMASMGWAYLDPEGKYINVKLGKVIRPLVKAYVQSSDDVTAAIQLMLEKNVNILPVFEGKKAVGLLRALDILDYLGDLL